MTITYVVWAKIRRSRSAHRHASRSRARLGSQAAANPHVFRLTPKVPLKKRLGAERGSRTPTPRRGTVFETAASACSAIPARHPTIARQSQPHGNLASGRATVYDGVPATASSVDRSSTIQA